MSMPLSSLTAPNPTVVGHGPTTVFSPVLEDAHTFSAAAKALQERHESPCTQTVEVPVWYGVDYNTCSMQTTTAPCSVDFPETSCHMARPGPLLQSQGMSGTGMLWIVIGITIFLTMLIPVVVLWTRWKLSAPRRGGKRSISVQLEKDEAKKATSTPSSSSSSTSKSSSNSKPSSKSESGNQLQAPNGRRNALDRLLGRNQANAEQTAGTYSSLLSQQYLQPYCHTGGIRIVNSIKLNARQPNHPHGPAEHPQHREEAPPMSPQIALESLRPEHALHQPHNRPWMHQHPTGRWVPREEGYLHPGLPPPPRVRYVGNNIHFVDQGSYVPGGWRN